MCMYICIYVYIYTYIYIRYPLFKNTSNTHEVVPLNRHEFLMRHYMSTIVATIALRVHIRRAAAVRCYEFSCCAQKEIVRHERHERHERLE